MEEGSSIADRSVYEQPCVSSRGMEAKSRSALNKGSRRPDKAIYVPRALRQSECETSLSSSSCSLTPSVSEESSSDNTDLPPANHEPGTDSANESVAEQDVTAYIAGVEPVDCDQTLSFFMAMSLEEERSSKDTSQTNTSCQNTEETDDHHHKVQRQIHVTVSDCESHLQSFPSESQLICNFRK